MTDRSESWIERAGRWGLLTRAGLLLVSLAGFFALVAPLAAWHSGRAGLAAAGLATVTCGVAGWIAMVVTEFFAPPSKPAAHVLVGMMLRMGLPLLVCLIATQQSTWLTQAGFAAYLVAAFTLGLALETAVSVGQLRVAGSATANHVTPGHPSPVSDASEAPLESPSPSPATRRSQSIDPATLPTL